MAKCFYCNQEMLESDSCTIAQLEIAAELFDRIKYDGEEFGFHPGGIRCGDCNVTIGSVHHPGCEVERCPKCSYQLTGCSCLYEMIIPKD